MTYITYVPRGDLYGDVHSYIGSIVFSIILFFMQGFSDSEISFAKATFSNLIGGISYFYGQSR